jgi:hypothetical protein
MPLPRRTALALGLAATLGACAGESGPPDFSWLRGGSPYMGNALLTAHRNLTGMSRYRGQPANGAFALAQYDFIMEGLQRYTISFPPAAVPLLSSGQAELHAALGVPRHTPNGAVWRQLVSAGNALETGQTEAALAALSSPVFSRGPQATLAALADLPRMPAIESVAPQLERGAGSLRGSIGN